MDERELFDMNDGLLKPLVKITNILKIRPGDSSQPEDPFQPVDPFQSTFEDIKGNMEEPDISEKELIEKYGLWKGELPFFNSRIEKAIVVYVHPLSGERIVVSYTGGFRLEKAEITGHTHYADCIEDITGRANQSLDGILKEYGLVFDHRSVDYGFDNGNGIIELTEFYVDPDENIQLVVTYTKQSDENGDGDVDGDVYGKTSGQSEKPTGISLKDYL